jgi:hypothetical protein
MWVIVGKKKGASGAQKHIIEKLVCNDLSLQMETKEIKPFELHMVSPHRS